ncbi:MAG: peptidoglycan DD-metalloendopeptidase family protein [Gammaproteobacteria bacterium]|nr:peptidoglycan DD-metalloendopeptidase family protein [Gammaproteobacteria bacterium]
MRAPRRRLVNAVRVAGLCVALPAVLAACLAHTPAPVSERSLVDGPMPEVYTVQKYDTLYSVAWRYELDVVDLAARNGIKEPYVIKTGQRIALTGTGPPPEPAVPPAEPSRPAGPAATDGPVEPGKAAAAAKPPPAAIPVPGAEPAVVPAVAPKPVATAPASPETTPPAPPPSADPAPVEPAVAAPTPTATAQPNAPPPAEPNVPATVTAGGWRRPVAAKPVRGFGGGSKGLDYSLRKGTPIQAATSGVVVYAGPGLGGFRHLVIVKASERHLVAYGVNVQPNVKEGDTVRIGDAVARAGSGATGGQFHFEIRDRGKPIDPNPLLGG